MVTSQSAEFPGAGPVAGPYDEWLDGAPVGTTVVEVLRPQRGRPVLLFRGYAFKGASFDSDGHCLKPLQIRRRIVATCSLLARISAGRFGAVGKCSLDGHI
jgi:hypothetical protein